MQNDPSAKDIRSVWQGQTEEPSNVSLELIRYKAQQLEDATRQRVVWGYAAAVVIAAGSLYVFWRFDQMFVRMGAGVLVLWAVSLAYQARKGTWSGRLAPDATLAGSLDYYRQALGRQSFYVRAGAKGALPVLLSTALFLTPVVRQKPELLVKMLPFLFTMVAWVIALFVLVVRKLRAVQSEVDELDRLRKR